MLLDAIPKMHDTGRARTPVQGEVPNPLNPPTGCAFHPRCPHANERCQAERPALLEIQGVQRGLPRGGGRADLERVMQRIQAYRFVRRLFFISRSSGCRRAPPMRSATVVASTSMIIRCSRRDTIGL